MESSAALTGLRSTDYLSTRTFNLFRPPSFSASHRQQHFLPPPSLKLEKPISFSSCNVTQPPSPLSCYAVLSDTYSDQKAELADIDWDNLGFSFLPTDYMYVMKCSRDGNFSRGELQRFGNIELNPSAGVLNYGQGLFEGLKAYRKEDGSILLFRPEENAQRMRMGAERMCMPSPSIEQFVEAVKDTVLANKRWIPPPGKGSLYIRPLLMGSGAVLGLAPAPEYTFLIYVSPVGNYFKEGIAPIHLIVEHELHRATPGGTGGVKVIGNYAAVLKAQSAAKAKGYSDVLYLDCVHKRYLEEVSSCNIFVVKDKTISTPAIKGTILPGITRKSIIDVARSQGFQVEERLVTVDELLDADEVFCTGTAVVVSPVGSITYRGKRVAYGEGGGFGAISQQLYSVLTQLQMGLIEDKMSWTCQLN
ncbi:branched-chain amino acid aminotransferase 2, chloroplastic-like [Mangifera indica]|uniref:branched-chain amino acid aminotransferase 2, chloroplastic-like n=1 Tax=Mangifera indica TaxID=29780 RepID=UPI001CFA1A84|nr:branched-chain amino acid aminotransferase 2, chloroplastic-like [Mangifera indica]